MSALPVVAPLPLRAPAAPRRPDADRLLAELHGRHEAELLRFCRWMLKDRDDAADAVQDTWIRAMTALGEGNVRVAAHRPWLFAIARNVCLDRLRDRKRASLHEADEADFGDTPGADEVVALRQEADAALALVGSLSERQRAALLMRELAGMSVPDIATALGLTVDKAHWTIADARRALDEARSGSSLACEEVRTRMGAGHRGRGVRAHLAACSECRAHDRRARARRVLLLLPLWLIPRAAVVPAVVAALAVPVLSLDGAPGSGGSEAPVPRVVPAAPVSKPVGAETRPTARFRHPTPAAKAAEPARATAPATNIPAPTMPISATPAATPAPKPAEPAQPASAAKPILIEPVAKVVDDVAAVTQIPVVETVTTTATSTLRQVAAGL